ncbi:MAG: histidine phosphatase family protein [Nitrospirae bacterium]|nr:histidine phosphatase family protein [Nitrospirota bacterium]
MPTILLVRHGETDWNRSGQIMGERPVPLNRAGETQAKRLATLLRNRPMQALYSSPVCRTLQTADILGTALNVGVQTDRGLTEIGVGQWEGLFWKDLTDEIIRRNLYSQPQEARPPGGETLGEVQTRAVAAIERASTPPAADPILVVTHADVVRVILAHYLRLDLQHIRQMRIDHASLTALHLDGNAAALLCLNHTADLAVLDSVS